MEIETTRFQNSIGLKDIPNASMILCCSLSESVDHCTALFGMSEMHFWSFETNHSICASLINQVIGDEETIHKFLNKAAIPV